MRYYIMLAFTIFLISFTVNAQDTKKEVPKKDEMLCATSKDLNDVLVEKGFDILLQMTNKEGVVETVWTVGQSIIITATVPNQDKSCLLATMKDVTYNPKVIEEIWEKYKKQTNQKDI